MIDIHDIYHIFLKYFRTKRMCQFMDFFQVTEETRILDVGGTPFNWSLISNQPKIFLLNTSFSKSSDSDMTSSFLVAADGRYLPFEDNTFEIVYSNSVIEHLGNKRNQRLFANEIRRVGQRYYVQTPNKWFFIEPHLITPFVHWLPSRIQLKLLRNFTVRGWILRPTKEQCIEFMQEIRLLSEEEMRQFFPDSDIWREHFAGCVKSLIAVR